MMDLKNHTERLYSSLNRLRDSGEGGRGCGGHETLNSCKTITNNLQNVRRLHQLRLEPALSGTRVSYLSKYFEKRLYESLVLNFPNYPRTPTPYQEVPGNSKQ